MESETVQFSLNIPAILGGGQAYAGLTAGSDTTGSMRAASMRWSGATSSGTYTAPPSNITSLSDADIGSPGVAGHANYSAGVFNISGSGQLGRSSAGINYDAFNYDSTSWTGDGTLIAEVTAVAGQTGNAQPGIMFRDSSASNVSMAALVVTPILGIQFIYRTTVGGAVTNVRGYGAETGAYDTADPTGTIWLKLQCRIGRCHECLLFNLTISVGTWWVSL